MLFLMICGCLYLHDLFSPKESLETNNTLSDTSNLKDEIENITQDRFIDACVVLDAGHGGKDGGTFCENVIEKDVSLSVVMYIKEILEEKGIEVILTRNSDEFISLSERTSIANKTEADLFISIHCNYYEDDPYVSGIECYYCPDAEDGKRIAENIINVLGENDSIIVRNAKAEEYYVLKHTNMTAILLEVGYLSNYEERQKLSDENYQEMLAQEIAKGIMSYFE